MANELIKKTEQLAEEWFQTGVAQEKKGQWSEALGSYRIACTLSPGDKKYRKHERELANYMTVNQGGNRNGFIGN